LIQLVLPISTRTPPSVYFGRLKDGARFTYASSFPLTKAATPVYLFREEDGPAVLPLEWSDRRLSFPFFDLESFLEVELEGAGSFSVLAGIARR